MNNKNQNLNFYKVEQYYTEKFYQMPQVLFTSEKYRDMSNDARVMYALLKDRNSYSVRNHWFDENDNIYFIFTNNELMTMLNCGSEKLSKVKKELIKKGLLYQKRMGLNQPNRLYLLRPEVSAQDVYVQEKKEQELENKPAPAPVPVTDKKDKKTKKTKKKKKKKVDKPKEQDQDTENYFDVFTPNSRNQMKTIAKNSNVTVDDIKNIVFKAKGKALHDNGISIGRVLDVKEFPDFIRTTLQGVIKAMKSLDGVKNIKGYIYTSFYKGVSKLARIYNAYVEQLGYEELTVPTEQALMDFYRNSNLELD